MFNKKPKSVTRFIGYKNWFENNTVKTAAFNKPRDKEAGEISVFNIDAELEKNDEEAIYKLGDKTACRKPPYTLARADLKTIDIEQIKNDNTNEFLKVHCRPFNKHCNIRPIPNDASALNIAQKLVRISKLKIRN